MKRLSAASAAALAVLAAASCHRAPPPNVAAEVDGHPITYTELDKAFEQNSPQADRSNEDAVRSAKLDLLNSMITSQIMYRQAEKLGLTAVDSDVETEFNKMKAPFTKEEFERRLNERHMTVDDLKTQIRHDLTLNKLINKEITSHISISDSDVANFYNAHKDAFNHPEPQIHIAQILVTPGPDPNVHNLRNSKAQNDREAKSKIDDLYDRLQRGEDFASLAQNFSEDPNSSPNGGDMGLIPESNLDKVDPELKRMILSLSPGVPSKPVRSQYGYQILKVIGREPAGQRDLNDPHVQQEIREALLNRKNQLLQAAFYEVARNSSKVQNYFARSILDAAAQSK